jgi:ankyrin repeat protein
MIVLGSCATQLHSAAEGNFDTVEFLVENGADVNQTNQFGWTPFMTAARVGDKRILELLARSGADPYALTNEGEDAMTVASRNGHLDIVLMLALGRREYYGELLTGEGGSSE